jgi:hypothetical protein
MPASDPVLASIRLRLRRALEAAVHRVRLQATAPEHELQPAVTQPEDRGDRLDEAGERRLFGGGNVPISRQILVNATACKGPRGHVLVTPGLATTRRFQP